MQQYYINVSIYSTELELPVYLLPSMAWHKTSTLSSVKQETDWKTQLLILIDQRVMINSRVKRCGA